MRNQAGFTLIELVLVLAIGGLLLTIAFAGQSELRSRAAFDATVNKLVASISDAHNEATAGVNTVGNGDGASSCAGPPGANIYLFAGVMWSISDDAAGSTVAMDFYKATRPGNACTFVPTRTISVPSLVRMSLNAPPASPSGQTERVLFVRDQAGGLETCSSTGNINSVENSFEAGDCVAPATQPAVVQFYLSDEDGHTSEIQMDKSGLAKRIN